MASFLVINKHTPEECESIMAGGPPPHLKGTKFLCPCPYGEHSFYMVVDGNSAEEVIQSLPDDMRHGTRAVGIEIMDL